LAKTTAEIIIFFLIHNLSNNSFTVPNNKSFVLVTLMPPALTSGYGTINTTSGTPIKVNGIPCFSNRAETDINGLLKLKSGDVVSLYISPSYTPIHMMGYCY